MTVPPSQTLKDATCSAHQRLENLPAVQQMLNDDTGMEELGPLYAAMHSVYGIIEGALATSSPAARIDYRPRLPLLRHALGCLNHPAPPVGAVPPLFKNEGRLWGALYVLEGSVMGGTALHRALQKRLGKIPGDLLDFHGGEASDRWSSVRSELDTALQTSKALLDDALLGAILAFDLFHAHLTSVHRNRG